MALTVVNKKINVIEQKGKAEPDDLAEVITAAERSEKGRSDGVSNAEARAVLDLYLRITAPASPRTKIEAAPEVVGIFNAFFAAYDLPYGENKAPMQARIQSTLAMLEGFGNPLPQPPRTGSLQPLKLDKSSDAYVDVVKKQVYVKSREDDGAKFYGPFALDPRRDA